MPEIVSQFLQALTMPFHAIFGNGIDAMGEKRIYFLFLLSSLVLTFYIYVKDKRTEGLGKYLFNKKVWLSKSAMIDYCYIFFNSLVKVFLLVAIIKWGKYIAFYTQDFLTITFGYTELTVAIFVAVGVYIFFFTLLEDFLSYAVHWLFHYIPFLWEFHKVHHSATVLNPITQYRIHPVELFANNISFLLGYGLAQGITTWLFYQQSVYLQQANTHLFTIIFFIWGANLRHSHVKLSYFTWLENWIISPYQHQIHHSDNPKHFNKNLGSKLAIWDWMAGTLVKSEEATTVRFGIGEENKDFNSFHKTLWMPFKKMFIKKAG